MLQIFMQLWGDDSVANWAAILICEPLGNAVTMKKMVAGSFVHDRVKFLQAYRAQVIVLAAVNRCDR